MLELNTYLGLITRFLLLSNICGFVDVGRSLWREYESVIYNCCWSSAAQSFLGPSPVGAAIILWRVVPLRQQPYKFWGLIYFWHQPATPPGVRDR
jgi:hypothetical protein